MTPEFVTSFLTSYLQSLAERTREERGGTKFGFDWVIYNLALAEEWTLFRLPFTRIGAEATPRTKTESEFGVDFAFLSADRTKLRLFVLKDEVLTYSAFTKEDIDRDLRMACLPDLTQTGLEAVKEVEVILAYNQDDHREGVELYERFVANQPTVLPQGAALRFDRWNLTALAGRVREHLLTPNLMPQRFFGLFSYVCAQASDFRHGSDEWHRQLVPNWRRFLDDVLSGPPEERRLRLIPVGLLILHEQGAQHPAFETGWIDLSEWSMLRLWRAAMEADRDEARKIVFGIWAEFYVAQLERFYRRHSAALMIEDSLEVRRADYEVGALANAYIAYWHLGRIGLLSLMFVESTNTDLPEHLRRLHDRLRVVANLLVAFFNANPACFRPVLDVNHVELFLVWQALLAPARKDAIRDMLDVLCARLQMRRHPISGLPFIADHNSWELAFENAALKDTSAEATAKSSHLLLMLMEGALVLPADERERLLHRLQRELVEGRGGGDGERAHDAKELDLMSWVPPTDWETRILAGAVLDGESVTVSFAAPSPQESLPMGEQVQRFVDVMETARPFEFSGKIPLSVLALACLKHQSPLPPMFWRQMLKTDERPVGDG